MGLLKQVFLDVHLNFKMKPSAYGRFSQFDVDFSTFDME